MDRTATIDIASDVTVSIIATAIGIATTSLLLLLFVLLSVVVV